MTMLRGSTGRRSGKGGSCPLFTRCLLEVKMNTSEKIPEKNSPGVVNNIVNHTQRSA